MLILSLLKLFIERRIRPSIEARHRVTDRVSVSYKSTPTFIACVPKVGTLLGWKEEQLRMQQGELRLMIKLAHHCLASPFQENMTVNVC